MPSFAQGLVIRASRKELLLKLEENRRKHRDIFLEAQEGYRKEVIASLEAMLQDARKGKKRMYALNLRQPQDMTAEYDRAIAMLKMSQDEEIEIDEQTFNNYVLDNWEWKRQFLSVNSTYSAGASAMLEGYNN